MSENITKIWGMKQMMKVRYFYNVTGERVAASFPNELKIVIQDGYYHPK